MHSTTELSWNNIIFTKQCILLSVADVDECATGAAKCQNNSYCVNKENGYNCLCNTGYEMDSSGICVDVNECKGVNECNDAFADCINTEGSYK